VDTANIMVRFFSWANSNSGFIVALSTFAYVVATFVLAIQNGKAIRETQRQFNELNRGKVFPSLAKVADHGCDILCLKFENPTNTPVQKVTFKISEEWLALYDNLTTLDEGMLSIKHKLETINNGNFFNVMPKQSIYYILCLVPGKAYKELSNKTLEVSIIYQEKNQKIETYSFEFASIETQLTQTNDYVRLERHQIEQLNKINKTIASLKDKD